MADKPSRGLADVIAASTAVSDIDGLAGRLFYRGYAGTATFEEIAYLLQRGHAPSAAELGGHRAEVAGGRGLGKLVTACLDPGRPAVSHHLSQRGSVTPQPPGRTPHSAGLRASGTTQPQAPLRCPGGEDTPPAPPDCAPPARPSEAPAREAMN
jgi:Citrate synthase, C-terminal domain